MVSVMSEQLKFLYFLSEDEKNAVLDKYGTKPPAADIPMPVIPQGYMPASPVQPTGAMTYDRYQTAPLPVYTMPENKPVRSEGRKKPVGRIAAVAAIICAMLIGGGITAALLSNKDNPTAGVNAVSDGSSNVIPEYTAVGTIAADTKNHTYKDGVLTIYSDDYFNSDFKEYMNLSKLVTVKIESGVTYIRSRAFVDCVALKKVEIPDTVKSIGEAAFDGCTLLSEITLPEGLETIEGWAFNDCVGIKSIVIPASVKDIGYFPFANCSSLESIHVGSGNAYFVSVDGVLYNKDKTILIKYPAAKSGSSFTVPDGVVNIYPHAFTAAENLTNVVLPDTVTMIGDRAFSGCKSLTEINLPEGLASVGTWAFSGCTSIKTLTIPNSLTYVDHSAFNRWKSEQTIEFSGDTSPSDTWNEEWKDGCSATVISHG